MFCRYSKVGSEQRHDFPQFWNPANSKFLYLTPPYRNGLVTAQGLDAHNNAVATLLQADPGVSPNDFS